MQDYHKLLVWKRDMEFVSLVYKLTKLFPNDERFGMISQLQRAAVSVVANIVEGRGKKTDKDFLKFLYISNGSLDECGCYIELALELGYINSEQHDFMLNKKKEVGFLLQKFINSIKA